MYYGNKCVEKQYYIKFKSTIEYDNELVFGLKMANLDHTIF